MIQLMQITIEGFGSIVDQITIPLTIKGVIRIKGPVGSGKTTMFNALTWALYGKNLKGTSDVNTWHKYRPKDYSGTKVEVTFNSDNRICRVIRCCGYSKKLDDGAKGSNRVLLYIDGDILSEKSKIMIQKKIEEYLGLSYDLFKSSIMFGQGMTRLIQEPNKDKKKLFEEIFKLDYLNNARDIASEERSQIYAKYTDNRSDIKHMEDRIASGNEYLAELQEQKKNFNDNISKSIYRLKAERNRLTGSLSTMNNKVNDKVNHTYNKIKDELSVKQRLLTDLEKVNKTPLIDVVDDVLNLINSGSYKKAVKKLTYIKNNFKRTIEINSEIKELTKKLSSKQVEVSRQAKYKGEIKRLKSNIKRITKQISDFTNRKSPEIDPKFNRKLLLLNRELTLLKNKQKELESKLEDYNWVLSDPLSNQGIKAYLFDTSLTALNINLEKYSHILGFRIEFNVDLESARKDFVTLIERDGVIIEYDELSGGEKGLVNLTMCFALHETLTLSKDINLLLLDEVFENLDSDTIEVVISLIKEMSANKTIFLISHLETLPISNCRNILVSKENGNTHYNGI